MNTTQFEGDEMEKRLADGYAVLAQCWRQPTEELATCVNTGELEQVVPGVDEIDLDGLRAEHARLFVGPEGPPCPPYESVYRDGPDDKPGPVIGPSTHNVVEWYHEYNLGLESEWRDLPDHLATELEFAAVLLDRGETDAYEQFLNEHPSQWFDSFAQRVQANDPPEFYRKLIHTTEAAIKSSSR